jgi:ABC-type lipoprotein release transport system permease subunit
MKEIHFAIPTHGLAIAGLQLLGLAVVVVLGMTLSALLSARRLVRLKVAETLREL